MRHKTVCKKTCMGIEVCMFNYSQNFLYSDMYFFSNNSMTKLPFVTCVFSLNIGPETSQKIILVKNYLTHKSI